MAAVAGRVSGTQASSLCAQRTFCPLLVVFQRSVTPLGTQAAGLCSTALFRSTGEAYHSFN